MRKLRKKTLQPKFKKINVKFQKLHFIWCTSKNIRKPCQTRKVW